MKYGFGDHVLDEERFELRRCELAVEVQPKALSLLLYLVRHRDRVVGKQELFEAIWPGQHVTDGSLARAVSRHGLEELGDHPVAETEFRLETQHRPFLPLTLLGAELFRRDGLGPEAVNPSPEARHCAQRFRDRGC